MTAGDHRAHVCLLRSSTEPDPYHEALRRAGFLPTSQPVLRFTFINEEELSDRLASPGRFAGLIATSPRALEAVRRVSADVEGWSRKPVYVVGPKTAEAARALGWFPRGDDSGDAAALAQHIVRDGAQQPLLFLSGARRRDVLPEALRASGIPFEECCVYETHVRAMEAFEGPEPDWVVFFSPSGVEAVRAMPEVEGSAVRRAAIGPTTAEAIRDAGWTVDAVAASPTPEALVAALQAAV